MQIMGLSGKSGSGKDYVARIMTDIWGYHILPLALGVKLEVIAKFATSYEETFITKPPIVRQLLQSVGTEEGRDVYGTAMWVNVTLALTQWFNDNWGINKFVIPDVRFKNELQLLQELGHAVIAIVPDSQLQTRYGLRGKAAQHSSEIDLDDVPINKFDAVVLNHYNNVTKVQENLERALADIQHRKKDNSIFKRDRDDS